MPGLQQKNGDAQYIHVILKSAQAFDQKQVSTFVFLHSKQLVFKVTTEKKQDHYFQATHLEEREAWVKDIKRAITCLQSGKRFARKSTRKSIRLPETINLRYELIWIKRKQILSMKDPMKFKEEQKNVIYSYI